MFKPDNESTTMSQEEIKQMETSLHESTEDDGWDDWDGKERVEVEKEDKIVVEPLTQETPVSVEPLVSISPSSDKEGWDDWESDKEEETSTTEIALSMSVNKLPPSVYLDDGLAMVNCESENPSQDNEELEPPSQDVVQNEISVSESEKETKVVFEGQKELEDWQDNEQVVEIISSGFANDITGSTQVVTAELVKTDQDFTPCLEDNIDTVDQKFTEEKCCMNPFDTSTSFHEFKPVNESTTLIQEEIKQIKTSLHESTEDDGWDDWEGEDKVEVGKEDKIILIEPLTQEAPVSVEPVVSTSPSHDKEGWDDWESDKEEETSIQVIAPSLLPSTVEMDDGLVISKCQSENLSKVEELIPPQDAQMDKSPDDKVVEIPTVTESQEEETKEVVQEQKELEDLKDHERVKVEVTNESVKQVTFHSVEPLVKVSPSPNFGEQVNEKMSHESTVTGPAQVVPTELPKTTKSSSLVSTLKTSKQVLTKKKPERNVNPCTSSSSGLGPKPKPTNGSATLVKKDTKQTVTSLPKCSSTQDDGWDDWGDEEDQGKEDWDEW